MFSVGINIVGFSWMSFLVVIEFEIIVLDWFVKLLNLFDIFFFIGKF